MRGKREGLCRICHQDLVDERAYLHGPVAADDCVFCHHPHSAPRPNLLLAETNDLCFRCHGRGDLTRGVHHASLDEKTCTSCHDPHGGDDRFFLTRAER